MALFFGTPRPSRRPNYECPTIQAVARYAIWSIKRIAVPVRAQWVTWLGASLRYI